MTGWHDDGHTITVFLEEGGPRFSVHCPNVRWLDPPDGNLLWGTAEHIDPKAPCACDAGCLVEEEVYAVGPDWDMIEVGDGEYEINGPIAIVWYFRGWYDSWTMEYDAEFLMRLKDLHDYLNRDQAVAEAHTDFADEANR